MTNILILGTTRDPHVRLVKECLQRDGVEFGLLDVNERPHVSISHSLADGIKVHVNGNTIRRDCLIWNRLKLTVGSRFYFEDGRMDYPAHVRFQVGEWNSFRYLLTHLLPQQTVNNPLTTPQMRQKIIQQTVANDVGMLTPPTLLTNRKDEVAKFVASMPQTITKGFATNALTRDHGLFPLLTTGVTADDVRSADEKEFEVCPAMFQEAIKKAYELRIVVMGDQVFAFRINSQESELSKIDWRVLTPHLRFEPMDVSDELKGKLLQFMSRFDLTFGSFDFIVDEGGKFWFLECNEAGAWAWLDLVVDGVLSRRCAAVLKERSAKLRTADAPSAREVIPAFKETLSRLACQANLR